MNTPGSWHDLSPAQLAAVHDAAKHRARILRAEAMQAFWAMLIDQVRHHVRAAWRVDAKPNHPRRRVAGGC